MDRQQRRPRAGSFQPNTKRKAPKALLLRIFLAVALLFSLSACTKTPGSAHPEYDTVLYFSAHQDDETLEDFGGILQDLREGKNVHVILISDGSASGVYKHLLEEGYEMTREEFSASRDAEFTGALLALGVKSENIHLVKDRLTDGTLPDNQDKVREIFLYYLELYPDSAVRTHMYFLENVKNHKDHTTVGDIAAELYDSGQIRYLRLFIDPWVREDFEKNVEKKLLRLPESSLTKNEKNALQGAIDSYALVDPDNHRYGIGARSVKNYWKLLKSEKTSYCIDYDGSR